MIKILLASAALVALGSSQITSVPAFEADAVITNSLIPFPMKGHLNFDYTNQFQRITTSAFGAKQIEIDRFNDSRKFVFASMFGQTKCSTCFLKPPLFPLYVPPGAEYLRNETRNGYNCAVYLSSEPIFGINLTFWLTSINNQNTVVRGSMEVPFMGSNPITTTIDLSNVVPGPQAASLFTPPSECPTQASCKASVNVALVVDGSGSIAPSDFSQDKAFCQGILGSFSLGSDQGAAAVVQFATNVQNVIDLSTDANAVQQAISGMVQLGSGTATGLGINAAQQQLASRSAKANIMVIITDGQSNQGPDPIQAADAAKSAGTEIFCVGVGSGIDLTQLTALASEPKPNHVYTVSNYEALKALLEQLVSSACPEQDCPLNFN